MNAKNANARSGCTVALLLLALASPAARAHIPSGPVEVRAAIRAAADAVAKDDGILVVPDVIEQMTASALIFVENFCTRGDPAAESRCGRTVGDPAAMRRIVGEFLRDTAVRRPVEIEVIGARMARAVQTDLALAGWPTRKANALAAIDISSAPRGAVIELRTASGPVLLGAAGRVVVAGPGRVEIMARSGERSVGAVVQAESRSWTTAALGGGAARSAPIVGSVEATPDLFCYSARPVVASGPLAAFNWGRASFSESEAVRTANFAPFAQQISLDIRVEDESGQCGQDCREGLGIAFARAVAVWRAGCARCDPNSLSVIRLDPTVWVDSRIAGRLRRHAAAMPVGLDLRALEVGEADTTLATPAGSALLTRIVAYEQLSGDASLSRVLCSVDPRRAPWVSAAQRLVCSERTDAEAGGAKPVLRLRTERTSCGAASDFIACGLPSEQIELALGDYNYAIRTPRGPIVLGRGGGAPIDLGTVVLHEVGHWFGLPHTEIVGPHVTADVMSEVLDDGKPCVSAESMVMMNNASDMRWKYRISSGGGLRRSRAAR